MMWSMIQALIPLGLKAVEEALQQEVVTVAGRLTVTDAMSNQSLTPSHAFRVVNKPSEFSVRSCPCRYVTRR